MREKIRIERNLSRTCADVQGRILGSVLPEPDVMPEIEALQQQRGFSLIELMVVAGIVGIMGTIALPAFNSWMERSAVNNASATLIMKLKQARNFAVAQSRSVTVSFDEDADSFIYDLSSGSCVLCKDEMVLLSQFSPDLELSKNNGSTIEFRSRGTIVGLGTTVTLQNGDYKKCVTVNVIGRAYIVLEGTGTCL